MKSLCLWNARNSILSLTLNLLKKIADNFAKRGEKELIITFIIKSNCLEDSLKKKKEKSIRKTYRLGDGWNSHFGKSVYSFQ